MDGLPSDHFFFFLEREVGGGERSKQCFSY